MEEIGPVEWASEGRNESEKIDFVRCVSWHQRGSKQKIPKMEMSSDGVRSKSDPESKMGLNPDLHLSEYQNLEKTLR